MKKLFLLTIGLFLMSSCSTDVQKDDLDLGKSENKIGNITKNLNSKVDENYDFILSDRSDVVPNTDPTNYVSGYIQIYSPQLLSEGYTFDLEYFIGGRNVFGGTPTIYLPPNTHYAEINPYDMIQLYGCGGKTVTVKVKAIRKGRFQIVTDKTVLSSCNISLYLANCNVEIPKPSDSIGDGPQGF
ncbi:hypothetical protein SAMN05421866_3798 [Chryseobacterium oranimense]|uniref:Lipoprotein n=1 Tax=Chryseobacterium oranimense TaxID=421058 RepID=A0A1M5VYK4_9FLAO|nr:hypothetical protein [Chryseobacterium oranimense]SHH80260.1 hypothetical protein SAMN05421866_3798 [Chryseobacterium oranimense]